MYTLNLWCKDLALHFRYLRHIDLACPILNQSPPQGWIAIPSEILSLIEFHDLPGAHSALPCPWHPLRELREFHRVLKLMRGYEIVHVTLNERPLHWGLVAWLERRLGQRKFLVVVESTSSWRLTKTGLLAKLRRVLVERFAKLAISNAHAVVFTTEDYRRSLGPSKGQECVIPASWIDDECLVKSPRGIDMFDFSKRSFRVGYFSHLLHAKGIDIFLDAIDHLLRKGIAIEAVVYGAGKEQTMVIERSARSGGAIVPGGVLPYGPMFYKAVRSCDVVAVPNRLDEQPRIVFDAFSQAVPVVGAWTPGIASIVEHDTNGLLFPTGNAQALATALEHLMGSPTQLARLSQGGLEMARKHTHASIHQEREQFLRESLGDCRSWVRN
jgi:glycosyltransferase involved in cell wall biosynthesis